MPTLLNTSFIQSEPMQIVGNYVASGAQRSFANIASGMAEAVGDPNSGIGFQQGAGRSAILIP